MSTMDARARICFLRCMESLLIGSNTVSASATALCFDILLQHSFKRTLMDPDASVRSASCSLLAKMFQDLSVCGDTGRIANYFDETLLILSPALTQLEAWGFRCPIICLYLAEETKPAPKKKGRMPRKPRNGISVLLKAHTALVCVAEIARICPACTRDCLCVLAEFAGNLVQSSSELSAPETPSIHTAVGALSTELVSSVAVSLGYASACPLIERNMEFLLWRWLKIQHDSHAVVMGRDSTPKDYFLDGFPIHLTGHMCENMSDFVESVTNTLLPLVILLGAVQEREELELKIKNDVHGVEESARQRRWDRIKSITEMLSESESSTDMHIAKVILNGTAAIGAWTWPLLNKSTHMESTDDDSYQDETASESTAVQLKRVESIALLMEESVCNIVSQDKFEEKVDADFRVIILNLLDIGMIEPFGQYIVLAELTAKKKIMKENVLLGASTLNNVSENEMREEEALAHLEHVFSAIRDSAASHPDVKTLDGLGHVISDVEILMHIRGRIVDCNASSPESSRRHRLRALGVFGKAISDICKKRIEKLPVVMTIVSTLRMVCDEYSECWLPALHILGDSIIAELKGNASKRALLGTFFSVHSAHTFTSVFVARRCL